MYTIHDLFDLTHTLAGDYLARFTYPWEALAGISDLILTLGPALGADYESPAPDVWVHKTARVAPTAFLGRTVHHRSGNGGAPRRVHPGQRPGGRGLRGGQLRGAEECHPVRRRTDAPLQLRGRQHPGLKSHMGAGSITSNVKSDKTHVVCVCGGERMDTGRKKVGAMLGDHVEIGCNSVLNPGAVIGRNTHVYPLSAVRGTVAADSIFQSTGEHRAPAAIRRQ